MKKDLMMVGIIFAAICFIFTNLQHNLELERVHKLVELEREAKFEIMKISLKNDRLNKEYIYTLQISRESLNNELNILSTELNRYKYLEKIMKDLDRSN
jgi:hypothetical protein